MVVFFCVFGVFPCMGLEDGGWGGGSRGTRDESSFRFVFHASKVDECFFSSGCCCSFTDQHGSRRRLGVSGGGGVEEGGGERETRTEQFTFHVFIKSISVS